MDREPFWKVIEDAYRPDSIDHPEALKEQLDDLKWFEVIEFQARFNEAVAAADTAELRGAACLINGARSDEGFRDFRVWLVGRGRDVYERALQNPDTLADILNGDPVDGFGLNTAALRVYEKKTGMSDFYARLSHTEKAAAPPSEGAGWNFEDEAEMQQRFPRLCELYLLPADGE